MLWEFEDQKRLQTSRVRSGFPQDLSVLGMLIALWICKMGGKGGREYDRSDSQLRLSTESFLLKSGNRLPFLRTFGELLPHLFTWHMVLLRTRVFPGPWPQNIVGLLKLWGSFHLIELLQGVFVFVFVFNACLLNSLPLNSATTTLELFPLLEINLYCLLFLYELPSLLLGYKY